MFIVIKNLQRKVGDIQSFDKIIGGTRKVEMINRFSGLFAKKAKFEVRGEGREVWRILGAVSL